MTGLIVLGIVGAVLGVLEVANWSYNRGVKHTEERWSDAVGRKVAHDAYQSQRWNSVKQGTL